MKTYIFFAFGICDINGAHQYMYNKIRYLEKNGWRVLVFSSHHGEILVNGFERFEKFIYTSLFQTPIYYSKSEIRNTIQHILADIGDVDGEECVIESTSAPRSVWAELIASRLRCNHVLFLVQEKHDYNKPMLDFLRFKYNRHELAGITRDSLKHILNDSKIKDRDDSYYRAYCNNVFEDCEDSFSILLDQKATISLATIGRLSKPCVPGIIRGFHNYAHKHLNTRINVVIIGGDSSKEKEEEFQLKISNLMEDCKNVNLVFTGNVYPIPTSFVEKMNVFVSTAGSARASYNAGYQTIMVNPLNGEPVGVIGLDMDPSNSMYESFTNLSIEDCIDRALNHKEEIRYLNDHTGIAYEKLMSEEFARQLSYVSSSSEKFFYDERKLLKIRSLNGIFHVKFWIIAHLFGSNGLIQFMEKWRELSHRLRKILS